MKTVFHAPINRVITVFTDFLKNIEGFTLELKDL